MKQYEKQIIECCIKQYEKDGSFSINSIITSVFTEKAFYLTISPDGYGSSMAKIIYYKNINFNIDILSKLIQIISLIQFLIDEKYIIAENSIFSESPSKAFGEYINKSNETIENDIKSEFIINELYTLASFKFYVTYNLYEFYNNDFQNPELKAIKDGIASDKIIAAKNLRWLIIGIFLNFIVGLLNLLMLNITVSFIPFLKSTLEITRAVFT